MLSVFATTLPTYAGYGRLRVLDFLLFLLCFYMEVDYILEG